jgi:hypothetical protein
MHDDNGWALMGMKNGIPYRRIPAMLRQAQWMESSLTRGAQFQTQACLF